ncbi:MAG: hypothetical protein KAS12_03755, partial [Candidatus Aenigmarchaeota archaeon]|nr:hypothetical protein [Candidatus Aenigmarchaeota archaeon]
LGETTGQNPGSFSNNNLGPCFIVQAEDQEETLLNPTTQPGGIMGMYYGLTFEVQKDNWRLEKAFEEIEVSPVHQQYYQLVTAQKEQLEGKIKQGMAGISQSVADLELVEHDKRKYDEFNDYIKDLKDETDKTKHEAANLRLKSVFVDQVDFHVGGSGQGAGRLSMAFMRNNNIMPTIVDDFFRMESIEDTQNGKLKDLPHVEKKMLETKFNAYNQWLDIFRSTVDRRLGRLNQLIKSRDKTLKEYRDWLRPIIARHRMIKEMSDTTAGRKDLATRFTHSQGGASSTNKLITWVWKNMLIPDDRLYPRELEVMNELPNLDPWAQENLVYNYDTGLVCKYPWITKEWIKNRAKHIEDTQGFDKNKIYYTFAIIKLGKTNIKFASGAETEDGDFYVQMFVLSKNAMMVKLLELECIKEKLEIYIDDMMGIPHKFENDDIKPEKLKKKTKVDGVEVEATLKLPLGYHKSGGKYVLHDDCEKSFKKHFNNEHFKNFDHVEKSMKKYEAARKTETEKKKSLSKKEFFEIFPHERYHHIKHKKVNKTLENTLHLIGIKSIQDALFRKGPYENTFSERVTKFYLKFSGGRFDGILGMIKRRMKIAEII